MDNKAIVVSIDFLKEQIKTLNDSVVKLSDHQVEMNNVLIENTVIVKEHERRSLAIEGWAKEANTFLQTISSKIESIDKEIDPIQTHVQKVSKIVNFLDGVPVVLKVTVFVLTIISSLYGAFVIIHTLMSGK